MLFEAKGKEDQRTYYVYEIIAFDFKNVKFFLWDDKEDDWKLDDANKYIPLK